MDNGDESVKLQEQALTDALDQNRGEIEPGKPGDCEICGEWTGRLVRGVCAPCRDRNALA